MTADVILRAAARALAAHGYHGMSMRDLAREIGRSPASFYNYFDSKEELLFSVQQRAFDSLLSAARGALDGVKDPEERLYVFVLNHVRMCAAQPDVMRVLIHEAGALPAARRSLVRERKESYFELARRLIAAVAELEPAELDRSTYCLFGMLNWIYGWFEPERHGSPDDVARTIHRIFLEGVRADLSLRPKLDRAARRLDRLETRSLLEGEPTP